MQRLSTLMEGFPEDYIVRQDICALCIISQVF